MNRKLKVRNAADGSVDLSRASVAITTTRNLLTTSWTADVEALRTAIEGFKAGRLLANGCQVAFFDGLCDGVARNLLRNSVVAMSNPSVDVCSAEVAELRTGG